MTDTEEEEEAGDRETRGEREKKMRKEDREALENEERILMMKLESWARITIARHGGEELIPRSLDSLPGEEEPILDSYFI